MYKDYYLKFPDRETALDLFSQLELTNESNQVIDQNENIAIDEVGIIYNNDAVYETDEETGEVTLVSPPTQKEGYHYNYRIVWGQAEEIPLPSILTSYVVTPEHPVREFF